MFARSILPALVAGVVAAACGMQVLAADKQRLTIAAGTQGGSVYTYSTALSSLVNKYSPTVELSVRSGGTSENILLLESGEVKLAGSSGMDYYTTKQARPQESTLIRTLSVVLPFGQVIMVPKDSPANTLADLKGKRFAMNDRRTGAYTVNKLMLEAVGLTEADVRGTYQSVTVSTDAFRSGNLDAFAIIVAPGGAPYVTEMANSSRGLKFLWLSPADVAKITRQHTFFTPFTFPAKSLPGVENEAHTFGYWSELVAARDLPDEAAYQIVKVINERRDEFVQMFRSTGSATPQNTVKAASFPLHPGAQKYFREIGALK